MSSEKTSLAPVAKALASSMFPPWASSHLQSWKSWKVLLRCWAVAWVCLVIMLPIRSLATLGNTAFFAFLLSVMLPPNLPVQIFMMVVTTLVLGIALGWAISCAAMAAALAARDQTLLKQSLQKETQSAAGLANPDALFRNAIFNGDFLDTRSSAIFGVFLGLGCFLFALIRAYAPKLTLMSVFGTIAIDIFCSFGPLFPFAQYTLLNSLVTSVACYIAIALIFITLAFPETMNYSYLGSFAELIGQFKSILDLQDEVLQAEPRDLVPGTPLATRSVMARTKMITQLQQLMSQKGMLNLEFTWGRWNSGDVQDMLAPLQIVVTRLAALITFARLVGHPANTNLDSGSGESDSDSLAASTASSTIVGDTYLLRQFRQRNDAAEVQYGVRIVDILPNIREATAELRDAASSVIVALKELIIAVNTNRYKQRHSEQDARLGALNRAVSVLRTALEDFKNDRRFVLLQPFQFLLERADAGVNQRVPLRSLYVSYVFASNLISACDGILGLAENVAATAMKRPSARLWMPSGLRAIGKFIRSGGGVGENITGEDAQPEETVGAEDKKKYKLDPDSRPPKNALQRMANIVHQVYKWTKTPEALFTFRYVVLSIALWIPSVIRSSAHFVYAERGVWALIMAQTTLNIYASDQIFNYVMRIGGTFFGALLGMVCWYIGAGRGNGSPYGLAAIAAACLLPLLFLRLYAPPQYLVGMIMVGATFVLVVGYSWIDGNLPGIFQNVGLGWAVTWRRWVSVMIGCAASFIIMMLPPKSGRKAVRLRNASVISSLSYLYSHLTSLWLGAEDPFDGAERKGEGGRRHIWPRELREKFLALAEQIQDLRVRTAMSKWEGNIRGAWAFEEYNALVEIENDMLGNLVLMAGALAAVEPEFRRKILPHTFVLNPHFISDVISMFVLISQSLRTGEPLHHAQYKNLSDRLWYHQGYGYTRATIDSDRRKLREAITSYDYMFYATAVVGVLQMTHSLNELRRLVATLCGEVPLEGFERWREEYDRSHIVV